MAADIVSQFSKYRLRGEPVPSDIKVLLENHEEFSERTGLDFNATKDWAPWLDTSYLSAQELANPDISANVKAMAEVSERIAFVAAEEDGTYFGYWRGRKNRSISQSPLVCLDNEGQYRLMAGSTFAEALLADKTYDEEQFTELRDWFQSLGIDIKWKSPNDATYPTDKDSPNDLRGELYDRYLGTMNSTTPSGKKSSTKKKRIIKKSSNKPSTFKKSRTKKVHVKKRSTRKASKTKRSKK